MTGLRLRRGDRSDTEGIRALLQSAFPENPRTDPDVLRWQYWENPFGDAVVWVEEANERIVGNIARIPVPVVIGGRREQGVISVDSATAPDLRGRGLHSRKRDASNADTCRRGFVVGFHYQGPGSPLPRGDAPSVGPVGHYMLPIDAAWLARRLRLPRPLAGSVVRWAVKGRSGVRATQVETVPEDIEHLWSVMEEKLPFGIVKDEAWWRWRYEGHPHKPYRYFAAREAGELVGAAAVRVRRVGEAEFAYVLDLLAATGTAASGVLREVARAHDGVAAVSFRARPRTFGAELAKQAGLHRLPRRWEPSPITLHVRDACGNRPELLRHPWNVGWGESDHL